MGEEDQEGREVVDVNSEKERQNENEEGKLEEGKGG